MPQITYIDTEAPRRERPSQSTLSSRKSERWKSIARWVLRRRVAILSVMALYRFIGLGTGEMQQWGESIYALRMRVILEFGTIWDQSASMLGGADYASHPPLYTWLSTSFLLLFGDQLWVYRFTAAAAAALMVPLLYRLSRMLQSPLKSVVVTGLFAFAPLPVLLSRHSQPELLLTLCMTAAFYFSLRAMRSGKAVDLLLAGGTLGAAFMSQMLFPLSIPAALLLSALFVDGLKRTRALRTALLMTLISLPVWLPWAWTFAASHGEGAGFIFQAVPPFQTAFASVKEGVQDSTLRYYLNQLIINLSLLLPFAFFAMWRSLKSPQHSGWTAATLMLLAMLAILWAQPSAFELYIVPIMPLLFLHGVRGIALLRKSSRTQLLAFSLTAALCFAWSLTPSWRTAFPDVIRGIGDGSMPWNAALSGVFLLLVTAAALLIIWLLYRRNRLRSLLSLPVTGTMLITLTLAAFVRIWVIAPPAEPTGAAEAARALRSSNAAQVFLIGGSENPQLTFYLGGADLGWREDEQRRYDRLELHALGVEGIRVHLASRRNTGPIAVLIERDELTQNEDAAERAILPEGYEARMQ
ncbi:MAG: glycosyltransferase family 39 protein, partial [Bacteroidota bacterium]